MLTSSESLAYLANKRLNNLDIKLSELRTLSSWLCIRIESSLVESSQPANF